MRRLIGMKTNVTNRLTGLSKRQQQYLEVIDELVRENGSAGTKAVAERLDVRMPSVTEAVHRLREGGYVKRDARGRITLTERGHVEANVLQNRHKVLLTFMTEVLEMDAAVAEEEACSIEHATRGAFVQSLAELTTALAEGQLTKCGRALKEWKETRMLR